MRKKTSVPCQSILLPQMICTLQARSQAYLSGVANFHWKNHVVQNMRAYFILFFITIKCINCMQEKTEFSCMLQRPRLISTKLLGELSLATKIKQQKTTIKNCKKILRGGKKMASCCPGVAVATPCHPIATGLVLFLQALGPGRGLVTPAVDQLKIYHLSPQEHTILNC